MACQLACLCGWLPARLFGCCPAYLLVWLPFSFPPRTLARLLGCMPDWLRHERGIQQRGCGSQRMIFSCQQMARDNGKWRPTAWDTTGDNARRRETTCGNGGRRATAGGNWRHRGATRDNARQREITGDHGNTTGDNGRRREATGGNGRQRKATADIEQVAKKQE